MQVVPREEILSRPSPPSELDLNILILGIDSISNGHAQRKLPKSYNYIRDVLEGYIFMGHSVVGDGTTEQLAAFLTGKGEREYKESRRGEPNAKPVDDWNWIFKKAKGNSNSKHFVSKKTQHVQRPTIRAFMYLRLAIDFCDTTHVSTIPIDGPHRVAICFFPEPNNFASIHVFLLRSKLFAAPACFSKHSRPFHFLTLPSSRRPLIFHLLNPSHSPIRRTCPNHTIALGCLWMSTCPV